MPTKQLKPSEWKDYFNSLSKNLNHTLVTIEVVGEEIGDQTEVRWQVLKGLSADPREDTMVIFTENHSHRISHPKEVYIHESQGNPVTIEIIDQDNNRQLIRLQDLTRRVA